MKYTTPMKRKQLTINSNDFWIKVTRVLGQNYALVDSQDNEKIKIFFIDETSWVFDELEFGSEDEAIEGLKRNNFIKLSDNKKLQGFVYLPKPPFSQAEYRNEPMYSSGKYWK